MQQAEQFVEQVGHRIGEVGARVDARDTSHVAAHRVRVYMPPPLVVVPIQLMRDFKGLADRPWCACGRAVPPATQTRPGSIASRARGANERLQQQGLGSHRL
eukprot:8855301-Pyramimonas_sp.AAC.1